MDYIDIIISNVGKAFEVMINFEVLPGVSLLVFCIVLFVLHILFDIFWFGAKSFMSSDAHFMANKTRKLRWNNNNWSRGNKR